MDLPRFAQAAQSAKIALDWISFMLACEFIDEDEAKILTADTRSKFRILVELDTENR